MFVFVALVIVQAPVSADPVSFPTSDGGRIFADQYGSGPETVILAHGGRYNKEVGSRKRRPSLLPAFTSWRSISAVTVARTALEKRISIPLRMTAISLRQLHSRGRTVRKALRLLGPASERSRQATRQSKTARTRLIG